jgi:hypothetical protein
MDIGEETGIVKRQSWRMPHPLRGGYARGAGVRSATAMRGKPMGKGIRGRVTEVGREE